MHDYVLGFGCFMAGAFFVAVMGLALEGGPSKEHADVARQAKDLPPANPKQGPRREPEDLHLAWPECDCPSEAFHIKYYPTASGG
jgi:hypothetical protein